MGEIHRILASDTRLLDRIEPDVFDDAVTADRLAMFLAEPSHLLVVAVDDGRVVGQATAVRQCRPDQPAELYIANVGVATAWQRQGVGQRLVEEIIAWGRERGCATVWLACEAGNEPAKALYARYARAEPVLLYHWKL